MIFLIFFTLLLFKTMGMTKRDKKFSTHKKNKEKIKKNNFLIVHLIKSFFFFFCEGKDRIKSDL